MEGENKEEKGNDSRPGQKTETHNQGPKKEKWKKVKYSNKFQEACQKKRGKENIS